MVGELPAEFHRDDEKEDEDTPEDEKRKPRVNDYVFSKPHVLEVRHRIIPPPGYSVRNLPEAETLKLSTATLTKTYTLQDDGIVLANFRFDSGPRRITAAQYESLRKEVVKLGKEKPFLLYFDQDAKKHLDAGEIGKAVAEYRRLTLLHPKEALHHTEIARALLAGGMGAAARREAKRAIEVEPKSAKAHATLGWVLANDLIGRELRNGCDVPGSIAAYRKAKELDKNDLTARAELAVILQYSDSGARYADVSRISEAIAEYIALKKEIEEADDAAIDRELMTLYAHAGRWNDLKALLAETTDREWKDTYSLIATAATKGGAAAVSASAAMEPSKRRDMQTRAGNTLVMLRHYAPAADLLAAAAQGAPNAAALRQQADMVRKAVRHEDLKLDPNDSRSVLRQTFLDVFQGADAEVLGKYATTELNTYLSDAEADEKSATPEQRGAKKAIAKKDVTAKLMADLALSAIDIQQDGDETVGYRLRGRSPDKPDNDFTAYVVKENGSFRLAGFNTAPPSLALRALHLVEKNDVAAARRWLDWAREHVSGGGDDPVASPPFPAVWTRGREASADDVRLAAALLLPFSKKSSQLALPLLEGARATASPDVQWRIDQALLGAYTKLEHWNDALAAADRLSAKFPESAAAFQAGYFALSKLERHDEIRSRGLARLKKYPEDVAAQQVLGQFLLDQREYAAAMPYFAGVLDRAGAGGGDYNQHAWTAIFAKSDLEKALEHARHAASREPDSHAILNTLAVLYAENGKSAEAREALLESMEKNSDDELVDGDWYVVGRIAENYGITDAAAEAYRNISKPKEPSGGSVWELAQNRLKGLGR
jgi:tetratricopeptide (TPR) repeat protein